MVTKTDRVIISPTPGTDYSRVDYVDNDGVLEFVISCHRLSNPVDTGTETIRYKHNHLTFYTTNADGKTIHALDITHTTDTPQIQIHTPMIFKNTGIGLVLRSITGKKFFSVEVDDDGQLSTSELPSSFIDWANDEWILL